MKDLLRRETYKENERLIGQEETENVKACRKQLLAGFLGKYIIDNINIINIFT